VGRVAIAMHPKVAESRISPFIQFGFPDLLALDLTVRLQAI
jgi:hypothetical protein